MKIPNGHQAVMPYLILDQARQFMEFAQKALGAKITMLNEDPDGRLGHCEMDIHGCTIMFSTSTPQWPQRTGDSFIYVENADETFQKALEAGGTVMMELSDQSYGRTGGIKDPAGNIWWLTSIA